MTRTGSSQPRTGRNEPQLSIPLTEVTIGQVVQTPAGRSGTVTRELGAGRIEVRITTYPPAGSWPPPPVTVDVIYRQADLRQVVEVEEG